MRVVNASDFDPEGDGQEHPEDAEDAVDGKLETFWTTESYSNPLPATKPGVGLLLDLGEPTEVGSVEVDSDTPGYAFELMASDEAGATENDFEALDEVGSASDSETIELDEARTSQFWLIWITDLPGGAPGAAHITEVRLFSP